MPKTNRKGAIALVNFLWNFTSKKFNCLSSSVVMFEAQLTLKSLKSSSFLLANAVKNLNFLWNMRGEIFRIHSKFPIRWIPIEVIWLKNGKCNHTLSVNFVHFFYATQTGRYHCRFLSEALPLCLFSRMLIWCCLVAFITPLTAQNKRLFPEDDTVTD